MWTRKLAKISAWKATLVVALNLMAAHVILADPNTEANLPFRDDFESYPEGTPLVEGTNGWYASSERALVQTNTFYRGNQAAQLPTDVILSNRFDLTNPSDSMWVEMFVQPVRYTGTNDPVCEDDIAAAFYLNGDGYFVLRDSNTWVVASNSVTDLGTQLDPIDSNTWVQVDYWLNYTTKEWSFFLNGNLLGHHLGFVDDNVAKLSSVDIYNGSGPTAFVDNVMISIEPPDGIKTNQTGDWFTTLLVSSTNFVFPIEIAQGQSYTDILSFTIAKKDGGINDLYFTNTIKSGSSWLSLDVTEGFSTGQADATTITMTSFNTENLAPGVYTAKVEVAGYDAVFGSPAFDSPQTVAVLLTVNPRASLVASANTVQTGAHEGKSVTNVINVWNGSGYYTLDVTTAVETDDGANWLAVIPAGGSSTNEDDVLALNVVCDATHLDRGNYTGRVTLIGTMDPLNPLDNELDADNSPQTIEIALEVTYPPPSLAVSPLVIQKRIARGGTPAGEPVQVWNGNGNYTLVFEAKSDAAWLDVSPTNGTSAGPGDKKTLNTAFNVSTFAVGTYNAKITITGTDLKYGEPSENTPIHIPVAVEVYDLPGPLWLNVTDGIYTDKIHLQWHKVSEAHKYEIWRSETPVLAEAVFVSAVLGEDNTDFDDLTRLPGKMYFYWVRVFNQYNQPGGYSPRDSGYRRLMPPTDIAASCNTYDDRVRVNWNSAEGVPSGYEVWRNISGGIGSLIGVSASLEFDDFTATPGTLYCYWITATNALCRSAGGTLAEGWRRLPAPATVNASQGTHHQHISVSWTAVTGAERYELWRDNQRLLTQSTVTYTDHDVINGASYAYTVRALSAVSTGTQSGVVTGWLGLSQKPTMHVSAGTYTHKIALSWEMVPEAEYYQLQRSDSANFTHYLTIGTTTGLTFDDTDAVPGAKHYYRMRAVRGDLAWLSNSAIGWRRLTPPAQLSATQGTFPGGIRLTWGMVTGADSFEVWASTQNDVLRAVHLANISATPTLEYIDRTVPASAARYYWIKARNTASVSDFSFYTRGYAPLTGMLGGAGFIPLPADYDGDGKDDPAVYSATHNGRWSALLSGNNYAKIEMNGWGGAGWVPVLADYDGDGMADPAIYKDGAWQAWLSSYGYAPIVINGWGGAGWVPVPADYDGDGMTDPAIYKDGAWQAWLSSYGYAPIVINGWGGTGSLPVPADYDGDGLADPAIYKNGTWQAWLSGSAYANVTVLDWGNAGWVPVPADYDGDGLVDPAVYNETAAVWHIWRSAGGYRLLSVNFGGAGFTAVPLDFTGDGCHNLCVYHRDTGLWWLQLW